MSLANYIRVMGMELISEENRDLSHKKEQQQTEK